MNHAFTILAVLAVLAAADYTEYLIYSRCEKYTSINTDKDPSTCTERLTKSDCESKKWCYWYEVGQDTIQMETKYYTPAVPGATTDFETDDGRVVQIAPGVYGSTWFTENAWVMVTPLNKIIWIDTGYGTQVTMGRIQRFAAAIGPAFAPGNLAAIIYGEGHTEHINQAPTILGFFQQMPCPMPPGQCAAGQVPIIANMEILSYVQDIALVKNASLARGRKTLGTYLPTPDPQLGTMMSVYPYEPPGTIFVPPSTYIPNTIFTPSTTMTISGVTFVFIPAQGDSRDAMIIWVPALQLAFVNDIFFGSTTNIGTIRGECPRNPRLILQGLKTLRDLHPAIMATGHRGAWMNGNNYWMNVTEIYGMLSEVVWLLDDLHTQTIALINTGLYDPDTIARMVQPNMALHPYVYAYNWFGWFPNGYSNLQSVVRGIYGYYIGPFDGFGADLWSITRSERAAFMMELVADPENMLNKAKKHIIAQDADMTTKLTHVAWAAKLADWVIRYELDLQIAQSEDFDADTLTRGHQTYNDAVRILGLNNPGLSWRYFYLTEWYMPETQHH